MYSKENWKSMAEKEPPFGRVNIFQTSPTVETAKFDLFLVTITLDIKHGNKLPESVARSLAVCFVILHRMTQYAQGNGNRT